MHGGEALLAGGGWAPRPTTRVAAVIGDPVSHSLSPALHNAAYRALGLDWVYVAFPVPAGGAAAAVAAVRALGLAGMSVTMPHKGAAAAACDRLTPTADRLGAVNTITPQGGELVGDSTDGAGLLDALAADPGWSAAGRACCLLGTGGAARSVALALAEAGAATVTVVGKRPAAAAATAAMAGHAGRVGSAEAVAGAELVVNATPVGMAGGPDPGGLPLGLDPERLGPGQLVVDLVYWPSETPLLRAAAARGATVRDGSGMLVHQAARQVEAWVGSPAPVAVMAAALAAARAPT